MTSIRLRLNRERALKDGTYPLVFQIIHNRRKRLVYTGYSLFPDEFDTGRGCPGANTGKRFGASMFRKMKQTLKVCLHDMEQAVEELGKDGNSYTAADVVRKFRDIRGCQSLLGYFDIVIGKKLSMNRFGTAAAVRSTRASVAAFVGTRYVSISGLNASFVRNYENFLLDSGVCMNTVCYYMRNLRCIYNQARLEGFRVPVQSPFRNIRSRPCRTVKRALEPDLIRRIWKLDLTGSPDLEIARDLFMFSFFARGMSLVDMVYLKKENISDRIMTYCRHKTGQRLQMLLTPQMSAIVRKYDNPSEYVFPILHGDRPEERHRIYRRALEKTNRSLKNVGAICGIPFALTSYVARHSWATRAKVLGVPVAVISESLGHSSEKTTRIYLKDFDRELLDAVNKMVSEL